MFARRRVRPSTDADIGRRGFSRAAILGASLALAGASAGFGCGGDDPSGAASTGPDVPGDHDGGADITGHDEAGVGQDDCIPPSCADTPLPASAKVIRLSHLQWENTTRDLLALAGAPGLSASFPADPAPAKENFGIDNSQLVVTSELWKEYQGAAQSLAQLVVSDAAQLARILPDGAKDTTAPVGARITAFLQTFLPRAFRRPVSAAEIARLAALGDDIAASHTDADPFVLRVRWIITQVLQSVPFLYRIEAGEGAPDGQGRLRLSSYEAASKLAYALWDTMPDESLLQLAASDKLRAPAEVGAVAARMLQQTRANATLARFHQTLFGTDAYQGIVKAPALFPLYYPQFGADAVEDVNRTIDDLVVHGQGGVKELFTSSEVWVTKRMAAVYGIDPATVPGLTDTNIVKTTLPAGRKGLLGHAGWLARWSTAKDPATILRGVWIARHLLCVPLGSPPPQAAGADPASLPLTTNRERVTAITTPCGDACHAPIINPLGFAFEGFDALGVARTTDNGAPVDASGKTFVLGSYTSAETMLDSAVTKADTHACYIAHWNAYLNGVPQVSNRPLWLSPIVGRSMAGASTREIVALLVQQDSFLTVSGGEP